MLLAKIPELYPNLVALSRHQQMCVKQTNTWFKSLCSSYSSSLPGCVGQNRLVCSPCYILFCEQSTKYQH